MKISRISMVLLLCLALLVSVTACSGSNGSDGNRFSEDSDKRLEEAPAAEDTSNTSEIDAQSEPSETAESSALESSQETSGSELQSSAAESSAPEESQESSESGPTIEASYPIDEVLTEFAGGKALVSYWETQFEHGYGLIDTNGYLLWSVNSKSLKDNNFQTPAGGMASEDGTYCLFADNTGMIYGPGMIILGADGTVFFDSREAEEGTTYYYLGYGDGIYLAVKNVAGFSENNFYLCEIDVNGNEVRQTEWPEDWEKTEIVAGYRSVSQDFTYFGNDLFIGTRYLGIGYETYIYDKSNGNFISTWNRFAFGNGYKYNYYDIDFIGEENLAILHGWKDFSSTSYHFVIDLEKLHGSEAIDPAGSQYELLGACPFSEGLYNCAGDKSYSFPAGIYDHNGVLVAAYPETWEITGTGAFTNGYAAVYLKGADGKEYVTIVDTNGNTQFDPVKIDAEGTEELVESYIGKETPSTIYYDEYYRQYGLIAPDGTKIETVYKLSQ